MSRAISHETPWLAVVPSSASWCRGGCFPSPSSGVCRVWEGIVSLPKCPPSSGGAAWRSRGGGAIRLGKARRVPNVPRLLERARQTKNERLAIIRRVFVVILVVAFPPAGRLALQGPDERCARGEFDRLSTANDGALLGQFAIAAYDELFVHRPFERDVREPFR